MFSKKFKLILFCGLLILSSSLVTTVFATIPVADPAAANAASAAAAGAAAAGGGAAGVAAGAAAGAAAGSSLDQRKPPTGNTSGLPSILPSCVYNSSGCDGANADINIFVKLGINIAKFIFAIIGMVAFVMFIYGGFTMILSFGSAEKFKKGRDILVAAVMGMIISFGAYMLVGFVLSALQVKDTFRIVK